MNDQLPIDWTTDSSKNTWMGRGDLDKTHHITCIVDQGQAYIRLSNLPTVIFFEGQDGIDSIERLGSALEVCRLQLIKQEGYDEKAIDSAST